MIETKSHVYRDGGSSIERIVYTEIEEAPALKVPSIADLVAVTEIMTRDITCAARDLRIEKVIELMVTSHLGCLPVVDERGRPIGMITKLDLVEQMAPLDPSGHLRPAEGDPAPRTAIDVMMPLAMTLGESSTVAHAAQMMASEDIHHVPIVDSDRRLIGLVSSMDIVRWLASNDGFAP